MKGGVCLVVVRFGGVNELKWVSKQNQKCVCGRGEQRLCGIHAKVGLP